MHDFVVQGPGCQIPSQAPVAHAFSRRRSPKKQSCPACPQQPPSTGRPGQRLESRAASASMRHR
eukprot:8893681-Lingulodinium_polyedra.AAC.1